MQNKISYVLCALLTTGIIFLLIQNKLLTEKNYTILAIENYKSYTYLYALKNNDYKKLKLSLTEDLRQLIKNYDKKLYFENGVLKHICKDIENIKKIIGKKTDHKIMTIIKDCKNIKNQNN